MTTQNTLKKIGYLIRFHRRKMNLTQMQFADAIGISFRNLQRLEVGDVEPRLATLNLIASYMGIPVSSLIRPTNGESLFVEEVSSQNERENFYSFNRKSHDCNEDLKFAQKLVQVDQIESKFDSSLRANLDGTKVGLSPDLMSLTGVSDKFIEIDDYIAFGTSLERWEYVFRTGLKQAIIQNFYFFPLGFKVFEEHHYNLNPNPDSPTSECYIRDISARHELETWLKLVHANMLRY